MASNSISGMRQSSAGVKRQIGGNMAEGFHETHDDDVDPVMLADEIEKRRLKFADVVDGHYEMPSEDEHHCIIRALRKLGA